MNFLKTNIKNLRNKSSLTQAQLASHINKGQTTIGNWENGISEPSLSELLVLSNIFGVTLDELVNFDFEKDNQNDNLAQVKHPNFDENRQGGNDSGGIGQLGYGFKSPLLDAINALTKEIGRLRVLIDSKL